MTRICPMCGRSNDVESEREAFVCPSCGPEVSASTPDVELREKALRRVRPPAVGIITIGILNFLFNSFAVLTIVAEAFVLPIWYERPELVASWNSEDALLAVVYGLFPFIGILQLVAGRRLRHLRLRNLKLSVAFATFLPTPLIFLSIPFGIWSLIVLTRPSVKAAFEKNLDA